MRARYVLLLTHRDRHYAYIRELRIVGPRHKYIKMAAGWPAYSSRAQRNATGRVRLGCPRNAVRSRYATRHSTMSSTTDVRPTRRTGRLHGHSCGATR